MNIILKKEYRSYSRINGEAWLCLNYVAQYFGVKPEDMEDTIELEFSKKKTKDAIRFQRSGDGHMKIGRKEYDTYWWLEKHLEDELGMKLGDYYYVRVLV